MVDEYQYVLHIIEIVLKKRFDNGEIDQARLNRCLARTEIIDSTEQLIKLAELYSIYITLPSQTK